MKKYILIFLLILSNSPALPQVHPGERDHLSFCYYPSQNKIILYGGSGVENGRYTWNKDMWSWHNGIWKNENDGTPGTITSMAMVSVPYDSTLLMIGGINPEKGDLNETWILKNKTWKLHDGNNPSPRLSPAVAYDPIKKVLILFSGCAGKDYPSDTWEWDGKDWHRISTTGPPGLCRASLFYDMNRKRMMLFGGVDSGGARKNEMWEWNGSVWNKVDQRGSVPEPRSNVLIAYDESRKRAILYGGVGKAGVMDDLWEWDGKRWYEILVETIKPGKREVYGITYHKMLKKTFLYGGRTGFAKPLSDLWSWNGNQWVNED